MLILRRKYLCFVFPVFLVFFVCTGGCDGNGANTVSGSIPRISSVILENPNYPDEVVESIALGESLIFHLQGMDLDGDIKYIHVSFGFPSDPDLISEPPKKYLLGDLNTAELVYISDVFHYAREPAGEWEVMFQLEDSEGNMSDRERVIFMVVQNTPPIARTKVARTAYGETITVDMSDSYSDADGDPITIEEISERQNGIFTNNYDGTITVTPVDGVIGRISCRYHISDGKGGNAHGSLKIIVSPPERDVYIKGFELPRKEEGNSVFVLSLPEDHREGFWSMNIYRTWKEEDKVTLSMSAVLKEKSESPIFMAFSTSKAVTANITVTDSNGDAGELILEILKQSITGDRENIYGPISVESGLTYDVPIPGSGFYIINVTGSESSERSICSIKLESVFLIYGVVTGGWIDHRKTAEPVCYTQCPSDTTNVTVLFGENYSVYGAEQPEFKLLIEKPGELTQIWPDQISCVYSNGETTRVSVNDEGAQADSGLFGSSKPSISWDGRYITFESDATDLVEDDRNGWRDVFLHDRQTGKTIRISKNSSNEEGNSISEDAQISGYGSHVVFLSGADNLVQGDLNNVHDIFVYDILANDIRLVSVDNSGTPAKHSSHFPAIDAFGRHVAFRSTFNELAPGSAFGIYSRDLQTRTTSWLGNFWINSHLSMSAEGRYIAFLSYEELIAEDMNGQPDIYVYDRTTGDVRLVSVNSDGNQGNFRCGASPEISQDGRYTVFETLSSNLVPNDTNEVSDIFLHDSITGETTRESINSLGKELYYVSRNPSISPDGRFIGFVVQKIDQKEHLYVRDRYTGQLTLISVNMDGFPSDDDSNYGWLLHKISEDGRYVVFSSNASDLVPGDTNEKDDIFVHTINPQS